MTAAVPGEPRHRNDPLRRDVNALGAMLGETIFALAGSSSFHCTEGIRRMSRARRFGDSTAEHALVEAISALDLKSAEEVIRAFTLFFDFSNIAEDRHRIRVLQSRERESYPRPLGESIAAAVESFQQAGRPANEVQDLLSQLAVDLVFTAHPSEAKRRTVRAKLRRMRHYLQQLDAAAISLAERETLEHKMRTEARVLWQTKPLRPNRPTVLEELDRCLALAPRLAEVLPGVYAEMRNALRRYYPEASFEIPVFLRFGFWVGGDRDGNPNVTNAVTAETLRRLRETAVGLQLEQCARLHDLLSISSRMTPTSPQLDEWIARAAERWPEALSSDTAPGESYRRFLAMVGWRLRQSTGANAGRYRDGSELAGDIELLMASLAAQEATQPLVAEVQPWHDLARAFGLQLARLDVRQDSAVIAAAMNDIFAAAQICEDFSAPTESAKCEVLSRRLGWSGPLDESALSSDARETLGLFTLLDETLHACGEEAIGGFVISMTRAPSDLLSVLWLWRHVQARNNRTGQLRIIPLFERIGDLADSAQTLDAILSEPAYLKTLIRQKFRQTVMLGYSDSTKDGGYLAACWGLWQAQTALHTVAARHGIALTFFHGRGGSLGRGGGPAARGILSLPRKTFDGSLRLTEQGEVLVERYDDVQIAARHLDQVVWATMIASSEAAEEAKPEWLATMTDLAAKSEAAYRDLVETGGFLDFFSLATPIDEIEGLPIGSRPARRRARTSLADLRAIPWVFSWTQNRCLIPAWYGLGAAVQSLIIAGPSGDLLREMYRRWPFFQATIDNAELALAKADLYIAGRYADLVGDNNAIWAKISSEYERTRKAVASITGRDELLANVPWFQASIESRNPYVDPLNLIQIELLRRRRLAADAPVADEMDRLLHLIRLSIQGIAACEQPARYLLSLGMILRSTRPNFNTI